jgi:hypothetical protein
MSATTILLGVTLGVAAGVLSGLFGVGGGILFVPALVALGLGQVESGRDVAARDRAHGCRRDLAADAVRQHAARPALVVGVASIVGVEIGANRTGMPEHPSGVSSTAADRHCRTARVADAAHPPSLPWGDVRRVILLALPVLAVAIAAIAAAAPSEPEALGTAVVARVTQPGQPEQVALTVSAPPALDDSVSGWAYPEDGSIVRVGRDRRASPAAGCLVSAQASSSSAVTLFGGEITVEALSARAILLQAGERLFGRHLEPDGPDRARQLITPSANANPLADRPARHPRLDRRVSLEPPRSARSL